MNSSHGLRVDFKAVNGWSTVWIFKFSLKMLFSIAIADKITKLELWLPHNP